MAFRLATLTLVFVMTACTTTSTSFTTPYSTQSETVQNDVDNTKAARQRVVNAQRYMEINNFERAKFHLDKALELDPKNEEVLLVLAMYYQKVKEPKLAKTNFLKALAINDTNPNTLNNYGVFLCEQGDYEDSVKMFLKSSEIFANKDIAGTFENAGFCSAKAGDMESASKYYRRALNYNQQQRLALLGMAEIEFTRNRFERTQSYLKRYEAVSSDTPRSLWLSVRNAQKMNDLDAMVSYGLKLEQLYPDSDQTEMYLDNKSKWLR